MTMLASKKPHINGHIEIRVFPKCPSLKILKLWLHLIFFHDYFCSCLRTKFLRYKSKFSRIFDLDLQNFSKNEAKNSAPFVSQECSPLTAAKRIMENSRSYKALSDGNFEKTLILKSIT